MCSHSESAIDMSKANLLKMSATAFFIILTLASTTEAYVTTTSHASLIPRNFRYKLPDGYSINRTTNPNVTGSTEYNDPNAFDPGQVYVSTLIAMVNLAYENSGNLTSSVSYPYQGITLNITGADPSAQYYRQFASYILYQALDDMSSTDSFVISNFTLQNAEGVIACKVIYAPPDALFQQLVNGALGSGGIAPPRLRARSLPEVPRLEPRQISSTQFTNYSAALNSLTPYWAPQWYGPTTTPRDFFMALATLVVRLSDVVAKDDTIQTSSAEKDGYHLNVTDVETGARPRGSYGGYLTTRGVLNTVTRAVQEAAEKLGYFQDLTDLEITLLWTNATTAIQQWVLRYEGPDN